jgi:hypothetical protein
MVWLLPSGNTRETLFALNGMKLDNNLPNRKKNYYGKNFNNWCKWLYW